MSGSYLYAWDANAQVWRKLVCNAAGKLIIDPSEIFENNPTDNEHGKAPDSDWAYDHEHDPAAHHTRYTDAEALMARVGARINVDPGTYTALDVAGKGMMIMYPSSGAINLKGLKGGVEGQMIYCFKFSFNNPVNVYYDSPDAAAGNRILTSMAADDTLPASRWGGFWLLYISSYWYVERYLNV